jgi:hypothetical protein
METLLLACSLPVLNISTQLYRLIQTLHGVTFRLSLSKARTVALVEPGLPQHLRLHRRLRRKSLGLWMA